MADFTVTCQRCKQDVTHVCDANLLKAVVKLYTWRPEGGMPLRVIAQGKEWDMYGEGDEDAPFFSEAYLYNALGKDGARTVLALLHQITEAAGLDAHHITREVNSVFYEQEEERKRIEEQQLRSGQIAALRKGGQIEVEMKHWPYLEHLLTMQPPRAQVVKEYTNDRKEKWRTYRWIPDSERNKKGRKP